MYLGDRDRFFVIEIGDYDSNGSLAAIASCCFIVLWLVVEFRGYAEILTVCS